MSSKHQKRFIGYELGLLTIKAALSTRDKNFPIYRASIKEHQKGPAKTVIREVLRDIEYEYRTMKSPEEHIGYIEEAANSLSKSIGRYLNGDRFRIGISQKLVNMHLKYLWCSGVISEPPHCPIDGIIRDKVRLIDPAFNYNWITSDSIQEYNAAIDRLSDISSRKNKSIAQWELEEFRRRDDKYSSHSP